MSAKSIFRILPDLARESTPQKGRPKARLICRVSQIQRTRDGYTWAARNGFFYDVQVKWFRTREEADTYAAPFNEPEKLLAYFGQFFRTRKETAAYLGIQLPEEKKAKAKAAKAEAVRTGPLTPPPVNQSRRYMNKTPFRVKPFHSAARPDLRFVVRGKEGGTPTKKFFKTKPEAATYADARNIEARNQGIESLDFPAWLRGMASRCNARLFGVGKTLDDATEHYLTYLASLKKSLPLDKLIAEYLETRRDAVCLKHFRRTKKLLGNFAEFIGPQISAVDITARQISDYIATIVGFKTGTKNEALFRVSALLKYAAHPARKYVGENVALAIDALEGDEIPVGILTPEETGRLLHAAEGKPLFAFIAIAVFAGLRVAEICRLDWSEIDLEEEHIEVTAAKSKTAARRIVKILPALRAWLLPVAKARGLVVPQMASAQFYAELWAIRQAADTAVPEAERPADFRCLLEHWPHNALRHSYASYHLAKFKNAAELALELGHSSTKMIFRHYRRVVTSKAAEMYFALFPTPPANVVPMPPTPSADAAPDAKTMAGNA